MKYLTTQNIIELIPDENCFKTSIIPISIFKFVQFLKSWEFEKDFFYNVDKSIKRLVFSLSTVALNKDSFILQNLSKNLEILLVWYHPRIKRKLLTAKDLDYFRLHEQGLLKFFYIKVLDSYQIL